MLLLLRGALCGWRCVCYGCRLAKSELVGRVLLVVQLGLDWVACLGRRGFLDLHFLDL